jgi:hypothetical protein
MKDSVIISPYCRPLRNNKRNAKNYPWWNEIVSYLTESYEVIQIGRKDELMLFKIDQFRYDLPPDKIQYLINSCKFWMSVDNFLPHFCNTFTKKKGIVLFSKSDPNIFGYNHNVNLLKDRSYLRPEQYYIWEDVEYHEEAFIQPEIVMKHIEELIKNDN